MHVRVTNSSTISAESGMLYLYWVKAGTAAQWEDAWTGNVLQNGSITIGGKIGPGVPVQIAASSTGDYEIAWVVPNPNDFSPVTPADINHFCLLARLETGCTHTNTEGENVWVNTKFNNRAAWRNINIVDDNEGNRVISPIEGEYRNLMVGNIYNATTTMRFEIVGQPNAGGDNFFNHGIATMIMESGFANSWINGGSQGTGNVHNGMNHMEFHQNKADLKNISMSVGDIFDNSMQFTFTNTPVAGDEFDVDVIQYNTILLKPQQKWSVECGIILWRVPAALHLRQPV